MEKETFYQEADEMSSGWGNYLRHIDQLRERFGRKDNFTLGEACWLLYAELYITSDQVKEFKKEAKQAGHNNLPWETWKTIFYNWKELG